MIRNAYIRHKTVGIIKQKNVVSLLFDSKLYLIMYLLYNDLIMKEIMKEDQSQPFITPF